jgi:hypothetical protein
MTRGYAFASQNVSFPTVIVLDIVFISFKEIAYKNYGYLTNILARENVILRSLDRTVNNQ